MPFEEPAWMPQEDKAPAVEREARVSRFWRENDIFAKSLKARAGRPQYVFYEGPPTANGRPHPGHVLTRVMKDLFPRYHTMTGKLVPRKAGWDTHGLPVEIEVEKELGLESKEDIERYGVEPFVKKCMESVFRYTRDWEDLTDRIGFWIDLSDAYVTYTREYVESVWWAVSQLWKKGLLYRGHKIVPWCTRCGTALSSHEVGWGYKTVDDPSITVKFKVTKLLDGQPAPPNNFLLAWTTTPWTLLSNAALAVKPQAYYRYIQNMGPNKDEVWIVGEDTVVGQELHGRPGPASMRALAPGVPDPKPTYLIRRTGSDLVGLEYAPLFPPPDSMLEGKKAHRVITADFVTLDEGTGIVHIAPAFGADDQEAGRENDLPTIVRTDERGMMTEDTPFAGRYCKEADRGIIRDLDRRGLLVEEKPLRHEYPHCWRCDTPLLYYPRAGWFIRTTQFRDRMLKLNRTINWYPDHIKEGRFGNFLEDNVDWALSRERYWGTPLPIWHCDSCGYTESVESYGELAAKEDVQGLDHFDRARAADPELAEDFRVHKPYVDSVRYACPKCSSYMARSPEVIDCWFDSGAMPFAQWGWPRAGEEADRTFRAAHPADFISEAIDQTRGWFYSLLAISTMLFDKIPYRNCVVLGLVCDEKGVKMSKSKGNYIEPKEILDTQGADALRWYFLSANQPWTSVRFSDRNVSMANKDFLIKLRNVYSFLLTYSRIDGFDPAAGGEAVSDARPSAWGERRGRRPVAERAPLDRWILGELASTIGQVREGLETYDPYSAARALAGFVESLSNWYLRRSRSRFWGPDKGADMSADKSDAYWTLYEALVTTSLLIAPFTPFAAEEFYQVLVRSTFGESAPESVHLSDYPGPDEFPQDAALAQAMRLVREASALGRAARAQAKIKVRTPLSEAVIVAPEAADAEALGDLKGLVEEELNVKKVEVAREDPPYVRFQLKPDFRALGPKLGPKVKELAKTLARTDGLAARAQLAEEGKLTLELDEETIELAPDDLDIRASADEHHAAVSGARLLVVLNTDITPELEGEGLARDLVSAIQGFRKELNLPYEARIKTWVRMPQALVDATGPHESYIRSETLSASYTSAPTLTVDVEVAKETTAQIGGSDVKVFVAMGGPDEEGDCA